MIKKLTFTILFFACSLFGYGQGENIWGAYTQNQDEKLGEINPSAYPYIKGPSLILHWKDIEPTKDSYKFDEVIKANLETMESQNVYCYLMIWVNGSKSPDWLYTEGNVTQITFDSGARYQWYLDPDYKTHFYDMIDDLGAYLCGLPDHLRKRILFVQCCEGSTGDQSPWHGTPPSQYEISNADWTTFRKDAWRRYAKALSVNRVQKVPLLINPNNAQEYKDLATIIMDETDGPASAGMKEGGLTHGYHSNGELGRVADLKTCRDYAKANGLTFFSRGELSGEWASHFMALNPNQALYWNGLLALHGGIGMWNIEMGAAKGNNAPAKDGMLAMNKYGGQLYPETASGAFCALRRGLDCSDVNSFSEGSYGKVDQKNQTRYENILKAFASYGARNGDMAAAMSGGLKSRRRTKENDCGWEITRGNWDLHLTQIDENETSVGWWQIDSTIYGRFARGFEPANNKDSIFFDLADDFFGGEPMTGSQALEVAITYRDGDAGSWELQYDAKDNTMKTAMAVTNAGTGTAVWKTQKILIKDAYLGNRGGRGADFILVNKGATNCRFHMFAIDKK